MALAITIVIALVVIVTLSIYLVHERKRASKQYGRLKKHINALQDQNALQDHWLKMHKKSTEHLEASLSSAHKLHRIMSEHFRNHLNCDLTEGPCIKPSPKSLS